MTEEAGKYILQDKNEEDFIMKKITKILGVALISIGFLAACDADVDNPDLNDPAVNDPAVEDPGFEDNVNDDVVDDGVDGDF